MYESCNRTLPTNSRGETEMTLATKIFIGWLIFITSAYIGHIHQFKFMVEVCLFYIATIISSIYLYLPYTNPDTIWTPICLWVSQSFLVAAIATWVLRMKRESKPLHSQQSRQSSARTKKKRKGPQRGGSRGFWRR